MGHVLKSGASIIQALPEIGIPPLPQQILAGWDELLLPSGGQTGVVHVSG